MVPALRAHAQGSSRISAGCDRAVQVFANGSDRFRPEGYRRLRVIASRSRWTASTSSRQRSARAPAVHNDVRHVWSPPQVRYPAVSMWIAVGV